MRWKESEESERERERERERETEREKREREDSMRSALLTFSFDLNPLHQKKTLPLSLSFSLFLSHSGHHRHLQRRQGHRGHPPRLRPGRQPDPLGLRRARVLRGGRGDRAATPRRAARHPRRQRRRRRRGGRREGGRGGLGEQAGAAAASRDTLIEVGLQERGRGGGRGEEL